MSVYRASAGSGKTFTIAIRYIELLIANPLSYRETLAVTFTNKATEEMKTRIISQLYGLSHELADSASYMKRITEDLKCNKQFVKERARQALSLIMHDYSRFNVETIDSFFQRVLRNLAYELGLNANLRVELNNDEIEELAVDKIISESSKEVETKKLLESYIRQRVEDNKSWNVISSIKEFGKKIFIQEYRDNSEELNDRFNEENTFPNYLKMLRNIISTFEQYLKNKGVEALNFINENGYSVESFSNGKTGACSYFIKLSNGIYFDKGNTKLITNRVQEAMNDGDSWVTKKNLGTDLALFAKNHLVPLLNKIENYRQNNLENYFTAKAILLNINELRLLNKIEKTIKDMNEAENRFFLSDTQQVLKKVMKDSDAPFVFEKIGGRIKNIMIDEFQDTSTIQWDNFKKLLIECMSNIDSQNMLVGDVKQSIYRWRNGDWRLLNNIDNDKDLTSKGLETFQLGTNYRSERRIVNFNNKFFALAAPFEASTLQEEGNKKGNLITQIFSPEQAKQDVPEGKDNKGFVSITLLKNQDYAQECMEKTKEHILTLLEAGAKEEDIAIIIRKKNNIYKLANWLKTEIPDHNFISDEAFLLCSSAAVNIIIDGMKLLIDPKNVLLKAQLAKSYNRYVLKKDVNDVQFAVKENINKFLPIEYINNIQLLASLPLYDIAERLFHLFSLDKISDEAAYINALFDQISSFSSRNIPDLKMFLESWDEHIYKKPVLGGDIKGIRIITIHSSKGLEFDHVILPFCDWDIKRDDIIWCKPEKEPFNAITIVPISLNSSSQTIFSKEFEEESLQRSIDNMNLLYVAFTRASKNLFIIGKSKKTDKQTTTQTRSAVIQAVIPELISKEMGEPLDGTIEEEDENIYFSYGELYVKNEEKKESKKVFLKSSELLNVGLNNFINAPEFRQSNRSRKFVSNENDDDVSQKYITQGTIMHSVLSQIHDAGDVERVLSEFVNEGVMSENDEHINKQTMSKLIRYRIEHNKNEIVNTWFSPDAEVFNECAILRPNPSPTQTKEPRPDRVVKIGDRMTVIDFKFGTHKPEYESQVRDYMSLISDMGHSDVDGYLWYVYKNEIKKIEA